MIRLDCWELSEDSQGDAGPGFSDKELAREFCRLLTPEFFPVIISFDHSAWNGDFLRTMTFDQIVRIAEGYSELGMLNDALEELSQLDAEQQDRVEVLRMRVDILLRKQEWKDALGLEFAVLRRAIRTSHMVTFMPRSAFTNSGERPKQNRLSWMGLPRFWMNRSIITILPVTTPCLGTLSRPKCTCAPAFAWINLSGNWRKRTQT